jgi:hypothetical protein
VTKKTNEILTVEQFAKEASDLWLKERARVASMTKSEIDAEIAAMPERDRFWVRHGFYPN